VKNQYRFVSLLIDYGEIQRHCVRYFCSCFEMVAAVIVNYNYFKHFYHDFIDYVMHARSIFSSYERAL